MMRCFLLALLVLPGLTVLAAEEPKKDGNSVLDGAWLPMEAEFAGQKFPDEILKTMKLVIKGAEYTVTAGGTMDKGSVKLDPSAKPRAIDITGAEGPNKGKTFLAIYELNGDTLRVCYDLDGKKRPTEFKTAADTKQFMVNYRKKKD